MEIKTLSSETRVFYASKEFKRSSNVHEYPELSSSVSFWEEAAKELKWAQGWQETLNWTVPNARWFAGGKINASVQCVDKAIEDGHAEKIALIWENEENESQTWTYGKLYEEVSKTAHFLSKGLGIGPSDRVAIYLPVIPEAVIAMLACARLGAMHTVIFAGFSAPSVRERIENSQCRAVLTCDITYRKGTALNLIDVVREATSPLECVKHIVLLKRSEKTHLQSRELNWKEAVASYPTHHEAEAFDSEHPLFVLYTSGTTGKPKGIVHTTGGYLVQTKKTAQWVFDLKPTDRYWCTADVGWITGHSYMVYGMLSNAVTLYLFEGALGFPETSQIWQTIEKHQLTIFYTAPTAIRMLMQKAFDEPEKFSLASLRLLGSVGEPINPEAWVWYFEKVGRSRCPIVDTWWQTETGAMMIAPLPGALALKPGSAGKCFPGVIADVLNENGKPCRPNEGGYLVIKEPWPSMARGILNDPKRFQAQYWERFPGYYFTGDGAHRDEEGYFWIKGRIDDVLNVSGHRLGTAEIESAVVAFDGVAEAAVVGVPDPIKGEAIHVFLVTQQGFDLSNPDSVREAIKKHVTSIIGAIARPDRIFFAKVLPKTRSGKIVRRFLKDYASGKPIQGDFSTLDSHAVIEPF